MSPDQGHYTREPTFSLTAEDIRTDVGRASSLVFQQVILTHQVFSQAEICDGNPVSSACTHKQQIMYCVMYARYAF